MQQQSDNRINPEFASIERGANLLRDAGYSLYRNPDTSDIPAMDYPEIDFLGPSFIPSVSINEKTEKAKVNGLVAKVRAKKPKSITEEAAASSSIGASVNESIGGNTEYINKRDIPLMEQYDELNDGTLIPKYERFTHGINNEEKLARQMTTGQKWGRGFKKLAAKSALYTAGGITQSVASIVHAIQKGSLDALYDNETTRWFNDQEIRLDHNLAHYYTEEEKNANFFQSMGSANFWANDVFGGMAYTIGAMGTEAVMAGLTGGGSLAVSGTRAAMRMAARKGAVLSSRAAIAANKKALKELTRSIARKQNLRGAVNTARSMWTGAGYESAVEALQSKKENELSYIEKYKEYHGGRMPSYKELKEFNDANVGASNSVFGANLAIVGLSNMVMFGRYMGVGDRLLKGAENITGRMLGLGARREGRKIVTSPLKGWQKVLGRTAYALEKPFTEGVFEEGLQGVASKASAKYLDSKFDEEGVRDTVSYIDALKEGFKETYGTKEGLKEVGIGALVGTIMGGVRPGGRAGFSYSVSSLFGGEYAKKAERLQKLVEAYGNTDANLTTSAVNTLKRAASFNAEISPESEVTSFTDFDDSVFAKLSAEEELGLLDSTIEDFNTMVDTLTEEQIEAVEGPLPSRMDEYKASLKDKYKASVDDYKAASLFARKLSSDSRIEPYRDIIALNAFRGIRARRNMSDIAWSIDRATRVPSIGRNLEMFSTLTDEKKALIREMSDLQSRIKELEKETVRLSSTVARTTETDENDRETRSQRDEHLAKIEEMEEKTSRIAEIDRKLASMSNTGYSFDAIGRIGRESDLTPTPQEYMDAYNSLMAFEEYISSEESADDPARSLVRDLVMSYRANMVNLKAYDMFLRNASDPAFLAGESKSWFSSAKNKVMEAEELNMSDEEFDFMLNSNAFSEETRGLYANDAAIIKAMEDGRINSSDAYTYLALNHAIYDYKNGSINSETVSEDAYNDIMGGHTVQPRHAGIINDIVEKLRYSGDETLTPRQREIYEKFRDEINREVEAGGENPGAAIRNALDKAKRLFGIKDDSLYDRNRRIINEVLDQNAPTEEAEREEYYDRYRGYMERMKEIMRHEEEGTATPEERNERLGITDALDEMGLTPLVMQNFYIEYKPSANVVPRFDDLDSIVSGETADVDTRSSRSMVQNPDVIMTHKDGNGMNLVSGLKMESFVERFLPGYEKTSDNGRITVRVGDGREIVFSKEKRGSRFYISDTGAGLLFDTTGILIAPIGNMEVSKWHGVYQMDENGIFTPIYSNNKYVGESIDQQTLLNTEEGDEVYLSVDLREDAPGDGYNDGLVKKLRSAADNYIESPLDEKKKKAYGKAREDFVRNAVIHVRDKNGNLISVIKSGSSDIRNSILGGMLKTTEENGSLSELVIEGTGRDGRIVEFRNGYKISQKLPGRPKFNIQAENGSIVVQNLPISETQSKKIVDVGYITNGKMVLKERGEATETNNHTGVNTFPFCTSSLRGTRGKSDIVPIIVIEHNGKKYAYPVSLAEGRRNGLAVGVINDIDASLGTQGGMELASIQRINTDLLRLRLGEEYQIPIGNTTEGEVRDALNRAKEKLGSIADYADPVSWTEASDGRSASEIARDDVLVNLDLDGPFYAPKLRVDFGDQRSEPAEIEASETATENTVDIEPDVQEQDNTISQSEGGVTDNEGGAGSNETGGAAENTPEGGEEASGTEDRTDNASVEDIVREAMNSAAAASVSVIRNKMARASGMITDAANAGLDVKDIQDMMDEFRRRYPTEESIRDAYVSMGRENRDGPYRMSETIMSLLNIKMEEADRKKRAAMSREARSAKNIKNRKCR